MAENTDAFISPSNQGDKKAQVRMTDEDRTGGLATALWFAGIALLLTAARWVVWIAYRVLEKGE